MARREEYEAKTEQLVLPIVEANQFELVDVEYVKEGSSWYLRIYIDKVGGITIDDCETVSRALNDILDENDFIADAYILEVSSPGLTRALKKDKDFQRSIGKKVEIKLFKQIDKRKEFVGVLKSYDVNTVVISEEDEELTIMRSDIALIKLAFEV